MDGYECGIKREAEGYLRYDQSMVDVDKIYLFGSYAYGAPQEDSDLIFMLLSLTMVQGPLM